MSARRHCAHLADISLTGVYSRYFRPSPAGLKSSAYRGYGLSWGGWIGAGLGWGVGSLFSGGWGGGGNCFPWASISHLNREYYLNDMLGVGGFRLASLVTVLLELRSGPLFLHGSSTRSHGTPRRRYLCNNEL